MDAKIGDFAQADVVVEGKKIVAVGPNLHAGGADEIDARGKIVMPGFIDTHHHQFETALRSFLANGLLINDGSVSNDGSPTPSANPNYFVYILLTFAPVYRPEDVYISELFGGLAQLDDGVTTVHDVSQIHHSCKHSDAAIQALFDTGRRAAFGFFESAGNVFTGSNPDNQYPGDAPRIKKQWFSSSDQLVTMIMGGEVYLPGYEKAWKIGRALDLQIAAHILSPFTIRPTLDLLAQNTGRGTAPLPTTRDVLRVATINRAKHLRLDKKTGSLTPGKEADIIILDATAINVAPLNNVPGAVVSLMDRTNVETVIVAGKVRKWKGKLLDVDLNNLRRQLENSRD